MGAGAVRCARGGWRRPPERLSRRGGRVRNQGRRRQRPWHGCVRRAGDDQCHPLHSVRYPVRAGVALPRASRSAGVAGGARQLWQRQRRHRLPRTPRRSQNAGRRGADRVRLGAARRGRLDWRDRGPTADRPDHPRNARARAPASGGRRRRVRRGDPYDRQPAQASPRSTWLSQRAAFGSACRPRGRG